MYGDEAGLTQPLLFTVRCFLEEPFPCSRYPYIEVRQNARSVDDSERR